MEVLDQPLIEATRTEVKYGGFWKRLGAVLLDGIFVGPFTIALTYYNIVSMKSSMLLIGISLIGLIYKPLMEIMYGATFGKMILKLKVVSVDLDKATPAEIIFRNIFHIGGTVLTLFFTLDLYNDPNFGSITGFMEYSAFTTQFVALQMISRVTGLITIVDGIVLIADKKSRALHDMIGKTFVIEGE